VRVIDCNECGSTIKAANDGDLAGELREHMSSEHPDVEFDADQAPELVSKQAYDATDS
jgi:peptide subunit release factor 1 (eRF1)